MTDQPTPDRDEQPSKRQVARQNARQLLAGYEDDAESPTERVELALEQVEADHKEVQETIRRATEMAEEMALTHRILSRLYEEHLFVEEAASELAGELDSQRDSQKSREKSDETDTQMAELDNDGIENSVAQNALIGRTNGEDYDAESE